MFEGNHDRDKEQERDNGYEKRIDYIVDGLGRRVAKKVNGITKEMYVYQSSLQIAAVLDGEGRLMKQFVYGSKPNVPDYMIDHGHTYRIISDQVGSPKLVVDVNTGKIKEEIDYDEFGNVLRDTRPGFTPFGFAGGLYDHDTRLVRFGARDYDASIGRWTTKDPIRFNGGDTNLYGYSFNDPANTIDSSGNCPLCIVIAIGAAVGASTNLIAYAANGHLTYHNVVSVALSGAAGGAAVVLTSGAIAASATAATVGELLSISVANTGFVSTIFGTGVDLGLSALLNNPSTYTSSQSPEKTKNSCPQRGSRE